MRKCLLLAVALMAASHAWADYETTLDKTTVLPETKFTGRHLDKFTLTTSSGTATEVAITQETDKLLYHDMTSTSLTATSGEKLTAAVTWTGGNWMHSYLYIDLNQDGKFDGTTELLSYSYLNGQNSAGTAIATEGAGQDLPDFYLPHVPAGTYRMRVNIDYNTNDPAGRSTIALNGGAIVDFNLTVTASTTDSPYATLYTADDVRTGETSRTVSAVNFASETYGTQSLAITQPTDNKILHFHLTKCFVGKPGETVTVSFDNTCGDWLNGFVYIDSNENGIYEATLTSTGLPTDGSEILAFSWNGATYHCNSAGDDSNTQGNVGVNPPSFTLPTYLKEGHVYRMRFKTDWAQVTPGGNTHATNNPQQKGGAIIDAMLYVPVTSGGTITVTGEDNGCYLKDGNGNTLNGAAVPSTALTIVPVTATGYEFDGVTISSGLSAPSGYTFISPDLAQTVKVLTSRDSMTLAAGSLSGNVTMAASFLAENGGTKTTYTGYAKTEEQNGIRKVTINGQTVQTNSTANYILIENPAIRVYAGMSYDVSVAGEKAASLKLYVDLDNDGKFYEQSGALSSEMLWSNNTGGQLAIPALKTGVYRARLVAEGESTLDFLLFVRQEGAKVKVDGCAMDGQLLNDPSQTAPLLPQSATIDQDFVFTAKPVLDGFSTEYIHVRHGVNLTGNELDSNGNRQWRDTDIAYPTDGTTTVTIPADVMDGDVYIYAIFTEQSSSAWSKIWSDEFEDGSLDTNNRWGYQAKYKATWNRYCAETSDYRKKTNTESNGNYHSYAMAVGTDTISGAINTSGKFNFTYGYAECRAKTNPQSGNFPAFWLMPQSTSTYGVWPRSGEIDIWEQINAETKAYGTIHTAWANKTLGTPTTASPTKTGNTYANSQRYNVYALEWDPEYLKWYVNGKLYFTYTNQHHSETLYSEGLCWPFDKPFYVIVNQSVGDGSWAAKPNFANGNQYQTDFDYVRVYQKKTQSGKTSSGGRVDSASLYTASTDPVAAVDVVTGTYNEVTTDIQRVEQVEEAPVLWYDLRGRRVLEPSLPGIYIRRQGTTATKVLIR